MPENMICEDYMSGCYCIKCGESLDDKLNKVFPYEKDKKGGDKHAG
jgi:hypothetical protein